MLELFVVAVLIIGIVVAAVVGLLFLLFKVVVWAIVLPLRLLFFPLRLLFFPLRFLFKLIWVPIVLVLALLGVVIPAAPLLLLAACIWFMFGRRLVAA